MSSLYSVNSLRQLGLQMDEGLADQVEELAKELDDKETESTKSEPADDSDDEFNETVESP